MNHPVSWLCFSIDLPFASETEREDDLISAGAYSIYGYGTASEQAAGMNSPSSLAPGTVINFDSGKSAQFQLASS